MISSQGSPTEEKCPKCGSPIVYNGNYFCSNWTYPYTQEQNTCDWALPHPQTELIDKQISYRLQGYWEEQPTLDTIKLHREEP